MDLNLSQDIKEEFKNVQNMIQKFEKPQPPPLEDMPPEIKKIINLDVDDYDTNEEMQLLNKINSYDCLEIKKLQSANVDLQNKCLQIKEDYQDLESRMVKINKDFMQCEEKLMQQIEANKLLQNALEKYQEDNSTLLANNYSYQKIISKKNSAIICNIFAWGFATAYYFLL